MTHLLQVVLILLVVGQVPPRAAGEPAPGDWPQWRGPNRTNVSADTGLLKEWPKDGPPLRWKATGLGEGVPSVAVSGGRIYSLGYREGSEFATASNEADGKTAWSVKIGPAVNEMGVMRWLSQRVPTVDGELLYVFTARGELVCLETAGGKERWRKDYTRDFEGRRGPWGFCDFPLVDGDKLICTPGGEKASLVALHKHTGEVLWKCAAPGKNGAPHGAAVVTETGGIRQYIHQLNDGVVGVSAADGKLLWCYQKFGDNRGNVHTPIVKGDLVFCSCGWGVGCALLKLVPENGTITVKELYRKQLPFDSWLGSSVLVGDHVHTADGMYIDLMTGQVLWRVDRRAGYGDRGTMTCADGCLYHRYADGRVVLSAITAEGYSKKGELQTPHSGTEPTWTFPVIAGGRLYLRDQDVLYCYDVKARQARRTRGPDAIFVSTPHDIVEKMLELAAVKKDDVVYDLGCGDGRIVVTAAKKYGCKAVGIDIDPECVATARANVKKHEVAALVTIEEANLFDRDLSGATVVALYLLPKLNVRLIPQLEKLPRGARIVSHEFDMPGVKPDKVVKFRSQEDDIDHTLYLWTTPLKRER